MKASDIIKKLKELQNSGSLITYVGRNTLSNLQIQNFPETYVNTNAGGADFSMTLKEVRIAKTAFVPVKKPTTTTKKKTNNAGTQQVKKSTQTAVYHTVKRGDTAWKYCTKTYKSLSRPGAGSTTMSHCYWILNNNTHAFRNKDFKKLQIGKRVLVGYRK